MFDIHCNCQCSSEEEASEEIRDNDAYIKALLEETPGGHPDRNPKRDLERIKAAYKECSENRRFEIERYWGRSTYFSVFLGAILVAVGGVVSWETDKITDLWLEAKTIKAIALFILTYVGTLLSLVWFYVGKGSKEWQKVYEMRMYYLENYVTGGFHKIFSVPNEVEDEGNRVYPNPLFSLREYPYSVSKLNLVVSLSAFIIWGILWIFYSAYLYSHFLEDGVGMEISNSFYNNKYIYIIGGVIGGILLYRPIRKWICDFIKTIYHHSKCLRCILKALILILVALIFYCLSDYFFKEKESSTIYRESILILFFIGLYWLYKIRRITPSFIIDFIGRKNVEIKGVSNHKFIYLKRDINNTCTDLATASKYFMPLFNIGKLMIGLLFLIHLSRALICLLFNIK